MDNLSDSRYQADYQSAFRMLSGPPSTWFGEPRASTCESIPAIPVISHPFDGDRVFDVLSKLTFQRTSHPMIREAFFDGISIGKIARNPYGPGWVASCSRKIMYWSIKDAGLALYQETRHE